MFEKILSIIIIVLLVIIKFLKNYIIKDKMHAKRIKNIDENIDRFINKHYKKILFIFLILIIISRIYKFGKIPEYIAVDEAGTAYDAYCIANYGVDRYLNSYPLYLVNFGGGQSALYAYVLAFIIKLVGTNFIVYRLPALLFFLIGIIVCYILADKFEDKKTALLFTFLIIICPWHIQTSRLGLDCDLLSSMFMLDLLLLLRATKNRDYVIAGIFIGLTLYTYAISYVLIPIFLVVYISYMLYIGKINIKQILLLGIPIFILALPLIYMILLNKGYVTRTTFGIFTIPKLPMFRMGEVSVKNIWEYGLISLSNIFKSGSVLFFIEIPLFAIGILVGVKEIDKSIQTKTFNLTALITIIFIALLITNLLVKVQTINKANILYLPMIYLVAIGIKYLCGNSYINTTSIIVILTILFINFEVYYYTKSQQEKIKSDPCVDEQIYFITEYIENKYDCDNKQVYFVTYEKSQPYIYTLLQKKISPYEFYNTVNEKYLNVTKYIVNSYCNYNFIANQQQIEEIDKEEQSIFVIDSRLEKIINDLENENFVSEENGSYYILTNF